MFRCVIFAAVSTAPQAAAEKDSLQNQIRRAQDLIQRRGWEESHPPLIVPGQSRSIDFLHEAMEEIQPMADLVKLARAREIDLVLCWDYDRLARTRALLTQLSTYLSRCRVQILALEKPVEPLTLEQLGRRGKGAQSAATIEAFAGLMAEGEVSRIVTRRYFGMNNVMRSGRWRHPHVAYGYTRESENSTPDETIYTDIPRIVPERAAIVRRIDSLFIGGTGSRSIAALLNAESIPAKNGGQWRCSAVLHILKNSFYCGWYVWGFQRLTNVWDPKKERFVDRLRPAPAVAELAERLGKSVNKLTIFDMIDHQDELAESDVFVVQGMHEPIRTLETQRAIYRELEHKRGLGGRAVGSTGPSRHLFSGIVRCARCDTPMTAMARSGLTRVYYRCHTRQTGAHCTNAHYVREDHLYQSVMEVFKELAANASALDEYLSIEQSQDNTGIRDEREGLLHSLSDIDARRRRWDAAYESGAIDLTAYSEHIHRVSMDHKTLLDRIQQIDAALSRTDILDRRRNEILTAISDPPPPDDRLATKTFLRRIIKSAMVDDGHLVRIILRDVD